MGRLHRHVQPKSDIQANILHLIANSPIFLVSWKRRARIHILIARRLQQKVISGNCMKFIFILFAAWLFSFAASGRCATTQSSRCENFITAKGDKLYDGDKEFRFISYNIPDLHYVEDNMAFDQTIPFRFPDEFEIRDALLSIKQSGGQVARIYTLSVRRQSDPFWSDPALIADFKKTIRFALNRVNTLTGITYKKDHAILAWETGNELTSPPAWTRNIAAFVKSIDMVTTHHYQKKSSEIITMIKLENQKRMLIDLPVGMATPSSTAWNRTSSRSASMHFSITM